MKAIQVQKHGSYEALEYVDVPIPVPGEGEVLIRTESISVNFADTMVRKGNYHIRHRLPVIPGFEAGGYVEKPGVGIDFFKPGQKVLYVGKRCYADHITGQAASVFPLPEEVDLDEAAAVPITYLTVHHMMHTAANVRRGQTVLAYAAAGGVGTAVAQLGKVDGLVTIGLTSSDEKKRYALEQGFDHVINYNEENVVEKVKEITGGRGADLVLNSVAGDTFHRDFRVTAPMGQIIWFGSAAGTPDIDLVRKLAVNFGKGIAIRPFHLMTSVAEPYPDLFNRSVRLMVDYLRRGLIRPQIFDRIPLSRAGHAHKLLEGREVRGKLILKP